MEGKEKLSLLSRKLSKSSRLKKKSDFRFARFRKAKTKYFMFVFGLDGRGRLGVSLSKRFLKSAVARNRIRRLLREAFRQHQDQFEGLDVNVLGLETLTKSWKLLGYSDVERELLESLGSNKDSKSG